MIIIVALPKEDLQTYINFLKKGQEDEEEPVRIKYETLDAETAFYWRCIGEHVKTMGVDGEELLDELLPEVSGFCKYIQGYVFCMTVKAVNYNPGQNSWDINATAGENDAFPKPTTPPPPHPLWFTVDAMALHLFQHNQHIAEGRGGGGQQKQALSTTFPSIYNKKNMILISKVHFCTSFLKTF